MNLTQHRVGSPFANGALKGAAALLFGTLLIAHWVFAFYIFGLYGRPALRGDFEAWNARLFRGIIEGDAAGNVAVMAHLGLALIVGLGGPMQLIPEIRRRFRSFHRWNGRIYITAALILSAAGLYLILARGGVSLTGDISLGLNAVLVFGFATMALRRAVARKIEAHRRWALRLFVAMGAVLFARIGFAAWNILTGELGHTRAFDGPFDVFWGFGSYLVPLGVLELYFRTQDRSGPIGRLGMAALLSALAALTAFGVYRASITIWLPYIT